VEGDLRSVPLSEVLELLHAGKRSGQLSVESDVPLVLRLQDGEVVGGGIFDWTGFEAISSFDLERREGRFSFHDEAVVSVRTDTTVIEPTPIMPFAKLLTEWARVTDELKRRLAVVGAPSKVFRAVGDNPLYRYFAEPLSVRGLTRRHGLSLLEAMTLAATGVASGELVFTGEYRWFRMRIRHHQATDPSGRHPYFSVVSRLTGEYTLGELIERGLVGLDEVRDFLIYELRGRHMRPRGRGALLRDLTWEKLYPV